MENKIMELKTALNLLTNQYFKSFKRFEKAYSSMSDFNILVKGYNSDFLKLTSAVLNSGNPDHIRANLHKSLIYVWANDSEQTKLNEELYWNILALTRTNAH